MRDVVIGGVGIHLFGRFAADYRRLGTVAAAGRSPTPAGRWSKAGLPR